MSFTCNFFAYFKFHSDWGRVIRKIKQNELDCRDTAPLKLTAIDPLLLRPNVWYPLSGSSGGRTKVGADPPFPWWIHHSINLFTLPIIALFPSAQKRKINGPLARWRHFTTTTTILQVSFRVPKTLSFKMRPSAQPFSWNEFYLHENEKPFPYQWLTLNLVLIQRPRGTRKWSIWAIVV